MAQNLFPTINSPTIRKSSDLYDKSYKQSFAWDNTTGDFIRDGANKVIACNGISAYQTWCEKMVRTERYNCLAYPDEIGAEMEPAMKKAAQRSCESAIERTIKEAIMVNPRSEYVRGFVFSWVADRVTVECTIKGIQYEEFKIQITVGGDRGEQASI